MSAVFNAIRAAQNAIACPVLAANDFVLGSVGSFIPGLNQPALAAINALRSLYGCDPADDVQPPLPDFNGGQCSARYTFNASGTGPTSGGGGQCGPGTQNINVTNSLWGPIGNVRRGTFFCSGDNGEASNWVVSAFGTSAQGQPNPTASDFVVLQNAYSATLSGFTRVDGQPDNCGDPDPIYPPPTTFNFNTDITYNNEEGDEVTVTIPFVFAPIQVDFNGNFRLPFTFDFGGNTFTGNFSLDPEFNLTINPPGLPPGSDQGTEDLPPGDPGDEVEPLPITEKIIGVVVTSSIVGEQQFTTILTQGMPNILAPRAGSIKFAYSLGVSTFWSNDIDVKGDRIFIPCPFSQGADAVVVSPAPGVALQWVPISGPPLATKADLA